MIYYNSINVIDLEATCWENGAPEGQKSEIIEIGICRLRPSTGEITDKRSIFVKNTMSEISDFCTTLTGITQEKLDQEGVNIKEACKILWEKPYSSKKYTWFSWGLYDRRFFQECVKNYQEAGWTTLQYPLSWDHVNASGLYAIIRGLRRKIGLKKALARENIELEGTHHCGADDAYNTAKITRKILAEGRSEDES